MDTAGLVVRDLLPQLQSGDVVEGGAQAILDVEAEVPGLAQGVEAGKRAGRGNAGSQGRADALSGGYASRHLRSSVFAVCDAIYAQRLST